MFIKLSDYKTGQSVLVNLDNIICIEHHSDRQGRQTEAIKGSRMLSNVHTATGTSAVDPWPVDVREPPEEIERLLNNAIGESLA